MATENLSMIGFRLGGESREALEELGVERGSTASELVRQIVIERLDGKPTGGVGQQLESLQGAISLLSNELVELRKDLRVSVRAILVASRQVTAKHADSWVKKNLYSGVK